MSLPVQLQDKEEVIAVIKRHPFSLWGGLALIALIFIVILILYFGFGVDTSGFLRTLINILVVVGIVGCLIAAFAKWYSYNNDLWIITNQRLIDSARSTPFNQQITTAALTNVQDISVSKRGILRTSLNFGDVLCQTASAAGRTFAFRGVANPDKVLTMIDSARAQAEKDKYVQVGESISASIPSA